MPATCDTPGCGRVPYARGLCKPCWTAARDRGETRSSSRSDPWDSPAGRTHSEIDLTGAAEPPAGLVSPSVITSEVAPLADIDGAVVAVIAAASRGELGPEARRLLRRAVG